MAVGLITSPAAWVNGTVAPATWFQNVQDTLNGLYTASSSSVLKTTTRYLWIPAAGGAGVERALPASWLVDYEKITANALPPLIAFISIPLASSTITQFAMAVNPAGASPMTLEIYENNHGPTAGASPTLLATLSSTGTGYQFASATVTAGVSATNLYFAKLTTGNGGDSYYGFRAEFTIP